MEVNHPVTRLPAAIKLLKLLYHKAISNISSESLSLLISKVFQALCNFQGAFFATFDVEEEYFEVLESLRRNAVAIPDDIFNEL